jgi:hypothetical protein
LYHLLQSKTKQGATVGCTCFLVFLLKNIIKNK